MSAPDVRFRPYVEVSALYENGLATVAVDQNGRLVVGNSFGESLLWGVSGSHSWRHSRLGMDYHGGLYSYHRKNGYDSFEQSLLLGFTQQLTRHAAFSLRQGAGLTSRVFGSQGLRQTVPFDPFTTYIPVTDYFNNRAFYLTSQADLTLQTSARLSFDLGGSFYLMRYHSSALNGSTGLTAHGDAQYRVSRRSTFGAQYQYTHFFYPHLQGSTDVHGLMGSYSIRATRTLEFSVYGGAMRLESTAIRTVAVDPVIAALLGITGAPEIVHTIRTIPSGAARLSRTFRSGVLYVSGGRSVTPGNGLFLTSTLTQVIAGYAYTGLRRWSFAANGGYQVGTAVTGVTGTYSDVDESVVLSRQLWHNFHFVASYLARQFTSAQYASYARNVGEARVGFGWSPGDIPLRVW